MAGRRDDRDTWEGEMSSNPLADKMAQGMLANVRAKYDAAQYAAAEKEASSYIGSIEQGKPEVRTTFAPALFKLYALRAHSRLLVGSPGALVGAQQDVELALGALDACGGLAPETAARLREDVRQLSSPEAASGKASLSAALDAPLVGQAPAPSVAPGRLPLSIGGRLGGYLLHFVVGLLVWGLVVLLFQLPLAGAKPFVFGAAVFGALLLTMNGWDWLSEYKFGTRGNFIKYFCVLLIAMTGVGLILVAYWTGRGTLQRVTRLREA
jgi:hypothetical protein